MTDLVILNGPEIGRTLRLREGVSFLGRSIDNDICIEDKTVSRKHLKIESIRGKHFVTDLNSWNGTFYDGKYVVPGHELEVQEGMPLAIGMTVICLGKGCQEQIVPLLDTVSLIREKEEKDGASEDRRARTDQKRDELLYRISLTLKESGTLKDILAKVLDHIFRYLKRIDRGAFVLADLETLQPVKNICKVNDESSKDVSASFSEEIVQTVLEGGKPLIFSKGYTEDGRGPSDTLEVQKAESLVCVPLINRSRIMGAMYVDSGKRHEGFRKEDLLILLDIGQRVALAVETERLAADLAEVARSLIGPEE
jgi:pSer/pThr/pTyr-binding forkhead associated (FHA) protein